MVDGAQVRAAAVTTARQGAGLTQTELAEASGISQGFVSKIENGQAEVDGTVAAALAEALKVPGALLAVGEDELAGEPTVSFHRRRRSKVSAAAARRVDALARLTAITVHRLLPQRSGLVHVPADIGSGAGPATDPAAAAAWVRAAAGLGAGPVKDMIDLVEQLGVVVVRRDLGTEAQDGVSLGQAFGGPVVLVSDAISGDRGRLTGGHELGHILLHRGTRVLDMDPDDVEREATRFATHLLMPPEVARRELAGLHPRAFSRLAELKSEWGVSMAALIEHAKSLDLLESDIHRRMRITLSQRGWHRREPGNTPVEAPHVLPATLDDLLDRRGYTEDRLAEQGLMQPESFRRAYLQHRQPRRDAPVEREGGVQS